MMQSGDMPVLKANPCCLQSAYMPLDEAAALESCAPSRDAQATGMTMVVLVTGSGGFVGAATAWKLKEQGHGERCCRRCINSIGKQTLHMCSELVLFRYLQGA